jgi:hypothetical protein
MTTEPRLLAGIDPNRPSAARIYDCFLGGTHNYAADRAVAARAIELVPMLPQIMKANRAFLHRAVRLAAERGVRQFIDIGSGIPTEGTVHEVARAVAPGARVVYADIEPTAVIHGRAILDDDPGAAVIQADLQDARTILDNPDVRALIDFTQPVCLLILAVLHFIPDSPMLTAALQRYRGELASGSYLAVSHATASARPEELEIVSDLFNRTGTPLVYRDAEQLAKIFGDWPLLEPGIVYGPMWRPDPGAEPVADPASYVTLAGMARKP